MNMHEHVKRYVAHKRSLGRKYVRQERRLLSWADAIIARGEDIIRPDSMNRSAQPLSSNDDARTRLAIARRLSLCLRA